MRIKSILLCICIVLSACVCQLSPSASAASIRNKKIVSIVYDDSTSMYSGGMLKWAYANYAMQSFAGMLNKEDTLMINYMSDVDAGNKRPVTVGTADRQKSVNDIRVRTKASGTPFEAIDVAYSNLTAQKDTNPNTQYWLVVMTDGEFFGASDVSAVEDKLVDLADNQMPNGSKPKIVYFSMCDTQRLFTPRDNLASNITVKKADVANEIAATISEISDEISGRYSVSADEITVVDDKTVKVTAKIPLLNIGVLTQFSDAEVTAVNVEGGEPLDVESNVAIKYPEVSGRNTDDTLKGNVALVGNKGNNIPAATYIISFSQPVAKGNLNIMFEPAIELRILLFNEDERITDLSKIDISTKLRAEAALYEMGTDNQIDLSLLPAQVTHWLKQSEGNTEISSTDQLVLDNIVLTTNETTISAELELENYFTLSQSISFVPTDKRISQITAQIHYDGSPRYNKDDGENVVYVSDLKKNKTGVKFYLMVENQPIDKATADSLLSKVKGGLSSSINPVTVEVMDDGAFLVHPSKKSAFMPSLIYWLVNRGEQEISLALDGKSAGETIVIKLGDWKCLIDLWPYYLLLHLILWLFVKKRFTSKTIIGIDSGTHKNGDIIFTDDVMSKTLSFFTDSFFNYLLFFLCIPIYPPACQQIYGYNFVAGDNMITRGGSIVIRGIKGKCVSSSKRAPTRECKQKEIAYSGKVTIGDAYSCVHFHTQR